MSIFATGVGSLAYIATVGMISEGGIIDLWFEFFWVIGVPLMTLLFAKKLRMSGIITFGILYLLDMALKLLW
jgi:Na+/proline symporter